MRLLTYLLAAALLWAVAATGPATSDDPRAPGPRAEAAGHPTSPPAPAHAQ